MVCVTWVYRVATHISTLVATHLGVSILLGNHDTWLAIDLHTMYTMYGLLEIKCFQHVGYFLRISQQQLAILPNGQQHVVAIVLCVTEACQPSVVLGHGEVLY